MWQLNSWRFCKSLEEYVERTRPSDQEKQGLKKGVHAIIGPCIYKSSPFNLAFFKPFGYAGDFSIVEMMYDFENSVGTNPLKSGIVNCLDYAFSTIHSVESIWERRRWIKSIFVERTPAQR